MAITSHLENYNNEWPKYFKLEQSILIPLFGTDLLEIHHVGSTAIIGMLAKPEIDILVVLKDNACFGDYFSKIESVGYTFRGEEPGTAGHWYFSKNQEGRRTHKLHLCGPAHPCVENQILFRDLLNQDGDRALKYAQLKQQLSENNTKGMLEYLEGKAPFIEETIQLAKRFFHLKNKTTNLTYSKAEQWSEWMKDFRYGTLVFIPSGELLKTGDQLRSQYDPKSAKFCASHITITQPFTKAPTPDDLLLIEIALQKSASFEIQVGPATTSPNKRLIWLDVNPKPLILSLRDVLHETELFRTDLPLTRGFIPHLTISETGHEPEDVSAIISGLNAKLIGWSVRFESIMWIVPNDDFVFEIRHVFHLRTI
jgi:GrpB-like predicted nucleotidyltransferase (UPF0157 family)/2'-5' RNA ligase